MNYDTNLKVHSMKFKTDMNCYLTANLTGGSNVRKLFPELSVLMVNSDNMYTNKIISDISRLITQIFSPHCIVNLDFFSLLRSMLSVPRYVTYSVYSLQ